MSAQAGTVTAFLKPIDRDGLVAFADKGRGNPGARGTNVVNTVCQGQYRTLSYIGDHEPVVVDEPMHLFGENTAPAPGEVALSALGGCLAVGNPAAWGAGGADMQPEQMGFQAIRVAVTIEGDASREELDEIVRQANRYSPVANTMRNPVAFDIGLAG